LASFWKKIIIADHHPESEIRRMRLFATLIKLSELWLKPMAFLTLFVDLVVQRVARDPSGEEPS
jgi:hypothetical protein